METNAENKNLTNQLEDLAANSLERKKRWRSIEREVVSWAWDLALQLGVIGKWATKERSTSVMLAVLRVKGLVIVETCGFCFVRETVVDS